MTCTGRFVFGMLVLTIASLHLSAQKSIPDDNLAYPVRIDLSNCGNGNTSVQGSGFFLNTGTEEYLVTARHVLFNMRNLDSRVTPCSCSAKKHNCSHPQRTLERNSKTNLSWTWRS